MADQVDILELNGGVPADDPTNGFLYIVITGVNYCISYSDLAKFCVKYTELAGLVTALENKRSGHKTLTAGSNTIVFEVDGNPEPFDPGADYSFQITDLIGLGITEVSRDENGIVLNSLENGTIDYLATLIT